MASLGKSKDELKKVKLLEISTLTVQIENTLDDTKLKDEQLQSYRERLTSIRQEMIKCGMDNMNTRRKIKELKFAKRMYIDGYRTKSHIDDNRTTHEREYDLRNTIATILSKIDYLTSSNDKSILTDRTGANVSNEKSDQKNGNSAAIDLNNVGKLPYRIEGPCVTVSYTSDMMKVFYISKNISFENLLDEVKRFYMVPKDDILFLVDNTGIICPKNGNVSDCCYEWYGNSWLQREVKFFVFKRKENKQRNKDLSKYGSGKSTEERARIERRAREIMKRNNPFHDQWLKRMFGSRDNYMQSFVIYCLFLLFFAVACITRRTITAEQNGIHAVTQAIKKNGGTFSEKKFDSITIEDDVWAWLQGPFRDVLLPETLYNGATVPPELKGKINIYNKLAGPLRLRQLRIRQSDCQSRVISGVTSWTGGCYRPYNTVERLTTKTSGWLQIPNATEYATIPQLSFRSIDLTSTVETILLGQSVTYDASGWIMDFKIDTYTRQSWALTMRQLRYLKYIDQHTRAVIIDFNVYLPNTDSFISCNVLFEFTAGGAVIPHLKMKSYVSEYLFEYTA